MSQRLFEGRFFRVVSRNSWDFVERKGLNGVIGVGALTEDNKIVLVKQYREPMEQTVIEIPAGLVGDAGDVSEQFEDGARRELKEETGYEAESWTCIGNFSVSPGLCNEVMVLFQATGLKKTASGGGDETESIEVIELPLKTAANTLLQWQKEGQLIDAKVFLALYFCEHPQ